MIKPFKDRQLEEGQLVEVYRNLHNNLFSIRDAKTKLVLAHGDDFYIENPVGVVSESGRKRVLDSGVRNVHAYIKGDYTYNRPTIYQGLKIYYNPFKTDRFENIKSNTLCFIGGKVVNTLPLEGEE